MARLFFVAGESSGDTHGANLIRALREADPALECEGLGGTRMADAGMSLRYDLASDAIMGFVEVFKSFANDGLGDVFGFCHRIDVLDLDKCLHFIFEHSCEETLQLVAAEIL